MSRYRFIEAPNKVICISTYAKKIVKGVAKCSPNDKFDIEIGKKLSQLRCDEKVAEKRMKRAFNKYEEALQHLADAKLYLFSMEDYYNSAVEKYNDACDKLDKFSAKV